MNTIRVEQGYLKQRARRRPPEFLREALELATVDGEFLCWPEEVFNGLRERYPAQDEPGIAELASNLAGATALWVLAGCPATPDRDLQARRVTCAACPDHQPELPQKCRLCGCTALKLELATERCPVGKWEAVKGA